MELSWSNQDPAVGLALVEADTQAFVSTVEMRPVGYCGLYTNVTPRRPFRARSLV